MKIRLPREAVQSPSLKSFKNSINSHLHKMIYALTFRRRARSSHEVPSKCGILWFNQYVIFLSSPFCEITSRWKPQIPQHHTKIMVPHTGRAQSSLPNWHPLKNHWGTHLKHLFISLWVSGPPMSTKYNLYPDSCTFSFDLRKSHTGSLSLILKPEAAAPVKWKLYKSQLKGKGGQLVTAFSQETLPSPLEPYSLSLK